MHDSLEMVNFRPNSVYNRMYDDSVYHMKDERTK